MSFQEAKALAEKVRADHPALTVTGPHRKQVGSLACYDLNVTHPKVLNTEVVLNAEDYRRNFWYFLSLIRDAEAPDEL